MKNELTIKQAYKAMIVFLTNLYKRTKSEDLARFIPELMFLKNGTTADPAAWNDWLEATDTMLKDTEQDKYNLKLKKKEPNH